MCLSATPLKRQTFLSVADMSEMSSQHVGNILLCRPIFLLSVVSVRPIADTHSYMDVGISIDEVVATYEDKKNWQYLRFCIHSQVLTLSKSK